MGAGSSQGHHTHLSRIIPPNLPHTEEKTVRACTLREMPFVTRASPYDETPSVPHVECDNHPSAVTWQGDANNTPVPSGAPLRKPHRNRVVEAHHIFNEGDRYRFEHSRSTTGRSPAAAEVGDVRLAGGRPKRALKALAETSLLVTRQIRDTVEGRDQTCTEND